MKIKGVIFDLDDTLAESKVKIKKAMTECYKLFNQYTRLSYTRRQFDNLYSAAKESAQNLVPASSSAHNRAIFFQRMVEMMPEHTDYELAHLLYNKYYDYYYSGIKLFPKVREVLNFLKTTSRKIVIISDGKAHVKLHKLHSAGLSLDADYIVSSEEVGVEKPAVQIFLLALHKSHLHPEEVIMVGNKYSSDIVGARAADIISVRANIVKNKEDQPPKNRKDAEYVIENMGELIDIINKIEEA